MTVRDCAPWGIDFQGIKNKRPRFSPWKYLYECDPYGKFNKTFTCTSSVSVSVHVAIVILSVSCKSLIKLTLTIVGKSQKNKSVAVWFIAYLTYYFTQQLENLSDSPDYSDPKTVNTVATCFNKIGRNSLKYRYSSKILAVLTHTRSVHHMILYIVQPMYSIASSLTLLTLHK